MIKEIIRPTTQNYTIKLPKEYLNQDIMIQVSPVLPTENKIDERIDIIRKTSGILAGKNIDPVKWQQKIRAEWEDR
ncbi:MAG: hypothetical protein U5L07_04960 [Desulfobacterales bacterium]|nr:hypothetical protein [Desulfobacterales bacterium]